jgi:hypothetical protein
MGPCLLPLSSFEHLTNESKKVQFFSIKNNMTLICLVYLLSHLFRAFGLKDEIRRDRHVCGAHAE